MKIKREVFFYHYPIENLKCAASALHCGFTVRAKTTRKASKRQALRHISRKSLSEQAYGREVILEDTHSFKFDDWKNIRPKNPPRKKALDSEGKPVALVLEVASKDHWKCCSNVEVVLVVVA